MCDPHPFKELIGLNLFCDATYIDLLKNDINFLNKKNYPCFPLHCHACSFSTMFDVIVFDPLTLEYVKPWQGTSYCMYNIVCNESFFGFGNGVIKLM
jgi:hypothetical protein